MANVVDMVSEITSSIPNATVWESEITSSIPASKVFQDFVLAYLEFFAKIAFPKEFNAEVVTLEGDGFGGDAVNFIVKEIRSELMAPSRWTVTGVDLVNFTCTYVYGGYVLYIEEMNVISLVNGGCTLKYKKTDSNTMITEDKIKAHKALLVQIFNAFEAIVAQKSNAQ